jgi:23S rRNA pseudouridine1911/1915/1917 synthase
MSDVLRPTAPTTLLAFLREQLPDWKANRVKKRLTSSCVLVNGHPRTHHLFALAAGDEVEVRTTPFILARPKGKTEVLHQDDHVIAIFKPAGLLSVASARSKSKNALAIVRASLGPQARLWPVHRLDRETSGVLLLARTREACQEIQAGWKEVTKGYFAVVDGIPRPADGFVNQPLREEKSLNVLVGHHRDAKPAKTRYWTRETNGGRALLEVALETGRKHQIRAHLAWLGTPVTGDERYGTAGPKLALHAHKLAFTHPGTGELLTLTAPVPKFFAGLLRASR